MRSIIPESGAVYEYSRVFTRQDIIDFARLTGDAGEHHTATDRRLMAQGLLVASIVTKIGGDMDYIAKSMTLEMLRPVYEDETITGRLKITSLLRTPHRIKLAMECEGLNAAAEPVIRGTSRGQIWQK
jgi:3-hydroxybutyryl-CoA dehydratase